MSRSILDLPAEVLDVILGYLPLIDQKKARLVCHRWNHQLSSPRYFKRTKLRLSPQIAHLMKDNLLRAAGQRQIQRIEVNCLWSRSPWLKELASIVQVIKACRFSLTELSFRRHMTEILRIVGHVVGKVFPLRNLRMNSGNLQDVSHTDAASVGFAFLTHLEMPFDEETHIELLSSLASQLTCLKLYNIKKELLERCFNELNLPALKALTLDARSVYAENQTITIIPPGKHGDKCWPMLAQLESFRYTGFNVPEVLLPCFQNVKCLEFDCHIISYECLQIIDAIKGLKELRLYVASNIGSSTTLQLPNLEHLTMSVAAKISLGDQMQRLISLAIVGVNYSSVGKLVQIIHGIQGRRLSKFAIYQAFIDVNVINCLRTLSIDVLFFDRCKIDGSFLELLAKPETRRKIWKIFMHESQIAFDEDVSYSVQTVDELRTKCPYIIIAET